MNHGTCIHFNGRIVNKACAKGILYEQFSPGQPCIQTIARSERGGTYLKPGERPALVRPFPGALPKERCPFYEEPTDEQVQADRELCEAQMVNIALALRVASEWCTRPKPTEDRYEVVECPACKGRLHLSQSAYNGHVHGSCETPGCVRWME